MGASGARAEAGAVKRAFARGCRKPTERTFWNPVGKTCCKKRWMKARAGSVRVFQGCFRGL